MTRQLLRNSKVVIEYKGSAYVMSALSQFSVGTSLGEVSKRRKTLFSNTTKQHSHTSRVNDSSISLQVNLTDNGLEQLFFSLVGLESGDTSILPDSATSQTQLFSIYIMNDDSVMYSKDNFVSSIDISLGKAQIVVLDISISSAGIEKADFATPTPTGKTQGRIVKPTYLDLRLAGQVVNTVTSASISIQQEAEWTDTKNLFDLGSTYQANRASTTDLILSATINSNYSTRTSEFGIAENRDLSIYQGGIGLVIPEARIVHNLDMQELYKNRLDVSISEDTGTPYFYFGDKR